MHGGSRAWGAPKATCAGLLLWLPQALRRRPRAFHTCRCVHGASIELAGARGEERDGTQASSKVARPLHLLAHRPASRSTGCRRHVKPIAASLSRQSLRVSLRFNRLQEGLWLQVAPSPSPCASVCSSASAASLINRRQPPRRREGLAGACEWLPSPQQRPSSSGAPSNRAPKWRPTGQERPAMRRRVSVPLVPACCTSLQQPRGGGGGLDRRRAVDWME